MAGATEMELLRKQLAEEKAARGALEAKLEVLLQQVSTKSEPERVEMLAKQAIAKKRAEVKGEALAVAKAGLKKGEKLTHLRYVTGSWYHRKGVNYPPGTTLKIPIDEEPAQDWKAWKRPVITRPTAVDPDAAGVPFGEVRSATSAIADLRRSELAGDTVVAGRPPPVEDVSEGGVVTQPTEQPPPPEEQATEPAEGTRASDTDVG